MRHAAVATAGGTALALFWASRPGWSPDMRLWKAVGDAALVLLLVTMAVGPLARLWRPVGRALPWRRETGIWFGVLATIHTVLILNGWARWSVLRFLGYELVPQLGRTARMEPGFGLANLVGLVALLWAVALAATSSDYALRRLGPSAWKWLHNGAYVVFYLVVLHTGYFLFLHYTASFHKEVPPPDWFRFPFIVGVVVVVALQMAAFAGTVRRRRDRQGGPGRDEQIGAEVAAAGRSRPSGVRSPQIRTAATRRRSR
ncbi:ferric reductase-like transmembrane domain-containing protein [Euzebya sp.]|uniref:ferric reductase-like transmembrane domain-containing protein n=1 Tax=Euzebya sp. TaxID=1971409 RepID=UPI003518B8D9